MRIKHINLEKEYAWRERPKIPIQKVVVQGLCARLVIGRNGRQCHDYEALIQTEDGNEQWVRIGSIRRTWADQEKIVLPKVWEKPYPTMPTPETQGYWGSIHHGKECQRVNPGEYWFEQVLKDYNLDYTYEPELFQNKTQSRGFRPDFYLPEIDTYVELTTASSRDSGAKRCKLRMMERCHPDIRVVVFYWEDFLHLAAERPNKEDFFAYIDTCIQKRKDNRQVNQRKKKVSPKAKVKETATDKKGVGQHNPT